MKKWQNEHPLRIGTDDEPVPGMILKLIEEEYVRYAEHLTEEETTKKLLKNRVRSKKYFLYFKFFIFF